LNSDSEVYHHSVELYTSKIPVHPIMLLLCCSIAGFVYCLYDVLYYVMSINDRK